MRKKSFALAVLTALATGVVPLSAQGPSPEWKAKNGHGNRYEGVGFDRKVTTFGLNLISLLAVTTPDTRSAIDISNDDEIVVDFFSRTAGPYLLTARELDLSEYYWMEPRDRPVAVLGPNTFKDIWKTDVLQKLKSGGSRVSVARLGVLVWLGQDQQAVHVAPAVMRAATAKPPQTITAYRATFLPDVLFDRVIFSVRGGCEMNDTSEPFRVGGSIGKQYADTSFPITFSVPATHSGQVMLTVATTRFVPGKPAQPDGGKPTAPTSIDDESRYCFTHSPASH